MAIQVSIQVKCDANVAFECAKRALTSFKCSNVSINELCRCIYVEITNRVAGDGWVSGKFFLINIREETENIVSLVITGDFGASTTPATGPVIRIAGDYISEFEKLLAAALNN